MSDDAVRPGKVDSRRVYSGRIVSLDIDTVRFPDGSVGEMEMFRHPGAAAVVPVLSESADPQILLIQQYRYATEGNIWEIPAGRLDAPGLRTARAARRDWSHRGPHRTAHDDLPDARIL